MKECKNCGSKISNRNVFCNNKCQAEYQLSDIKNEWLNGGNYFIKGGTSIAPWQRRILLEETKHKCSECDWSEINPYTNKTPLDIDHIDGNAYNNVKNNLRVLCPNCHSLKKTFKNTGSRKSTRNYRNRPE
jgi:Zn finger protein HypA/HybF involved in hydrogenase expression